MSWIHVEEPRVRGHLERMLPLPLADMYIPHVENHLFDSLLREDAQVV